MRQDAPPLTVSVTHLGAACAEASAHACPRHPVYTPATLSRVRLAPTLALYRAVVVPIQAQDVREPFGLINTLHAAQLDFMVVQ